MGKNSVFWTFFSQYDKYLNDTKIVVLENIEDIYLEQISSELLSVLPYTHRTVYTINLEHRILSSNIKEGEQKRVFDYGLGATLGIISGTGQTKKIYANDSDEWISTVAKILKQDAHVFIYGVVDKDRKILNRLIEHIEKECCITCLVNESYNFKKDKFELINAAEINTLYAEMLSEKLADLAKQKSYIVRILASENAVSKRTLIRNIDFINKDEYKYIGLEYENSGGYGIVFSENYLDSFNRDKGVKPNEKINYIQKAIKLVRRYDPFNLKLIGLLNQAMGLDDIKKELYELSTIRNREVDFTNFASEESRVLEYLSDCQKMYKTEKQSYVLLLDEVYEYFQHCYRETLNYGVIYLGIYLTAQFHNFGEIEKSRNVYSKLKIVLKEIEGNNSCKQLKKLELELGFFATAILEPQAIMRQYKDALVKSVIRENIQKGSFAIQLFYSNIMGCFDVHELNTDISSCIYEELSNSNIKKYKKKIWNNMMIHELQYHIEPKITKKIYKELIINQNDNSDLKHFITFYNLLYYVKDNEKKFQCVKEKLNVEYKEKTPDDFYDFYYNFIEEYFSPHDYVHTKSNLPLPNMYHGRIISKKIEEVLEKNKTSSSKKYLFIDQNFWGEE